MKNKNTLSFYRGANILVTGGLGFIGSALVRKLVNFGANVVIVDSLRPEQGGNLFNIHGIENKVKVNISDIRDRESMNQLVRNQDMMFNLAGTLSHIDSMQDPFTDLEINSLGQLTILEACRENNPKIKIIYAGTRNQFGRAKYLPVDEEHPQIPTDVNGINRISGEQYHLLYNHVYGIKTCSLRVSNTYGPRHQMKHPRQGVLNWFLRQIMDGEKIELHGTGEQIRDTNFVDDIVDAFILAGASRKAWGKAYNLGGFPVSLKKFVETAIEVYGKGSFKIVPQPEERKKIEIGDFVADYSKIKRELGWEPKISLKTGIRNTFKYYERYKKYYWS